MRISSFAELFTKARERLRSFEERGTKARMYLGYSRLQTEGTTPAADFRKRYPDLVARGGLAMALQAALADAGSSLTVSKFRKIPGMPVFTHVKRDERFAQVFVGSEGRLFLFNLWKHGVELAEGSTGDLREMARAIDRWVAGDCSMGELAGDFAWIRVKPQAAIHERGEEVEYRWQQYLDSLHKRFPELEAFVHAAAAHPKLRQLFPYTSLNEFRFSRCTGYPFTRGTPSVHPAGRMGVRPDGEAEYFVLGAEDEFLGPVNAEEAVRLVVAALPPDCGPAVPGTAEFMDKA